MTADVSLRTVAPRPTAVVSQTTTWKEFPAVWKPLLDEVYSFVRGRAPELAPNDGPDVWRNAFLYLDDQPTVEIGVLVARSFESHVHRRPGPGPGRPELGDLRALARGHERARDRGLLPRPRTGLDLVPGRRTYTEFVPRVLNS